MRSDSVIRNVKIGFFRGTLLYTDVLFANILILILNSCKEMFRRTMKNYDLILMLNYFLNM